HEAVAALLEERAHLVLVDLSFVWRASPAYRPVVQAQHVLLVGRHQEAGLRRHLVQEEVAGGEEGGGGDVAVVAVLPDPVGAAGRRGPPRRAVGDRPVRPGGEAGHHEQHQEAAPGEPPPGPGHRRNLPSGSESPPEASALPITRRRTEGWKKR